MKLPLALILAALCLLSQSGCGKKEARTPSVPPPAPPKMPAAEATAPDAAPPPPSAPQAAPAAAAAPAAPDPDVLVTLTHYIQSFSISNGRPPRSLDELVTSKMLSQLPEPPAGKRFQYDLKTVEVKLVNQ